MGEVQILDGELFVDVSDNDIAILRLYRSVDYSDVTITDAGLHHRVLIQRPEWTSNASSDTIKISKIVPRLTLFKQKKHKCL